MREADRDRGIDRIAALLQNVDADPRRARLLRHHHAVWRDDRIALRNRAARRGQSLRGRVRGADRKCGDRDQENCASNRRRDGSGHGCHYSHTFRPRPMRLLFGNGKFQMDPQRGFVSQRQCADQANAPRPDGLQYKRRLCRPFTSIVTANFRAAKRCCLRSSLGRKRWSSMSVPISARIRCFLPRR